MNEFTSFIQALAQNFKYAPVSLPHPDSGSFWRLRDWFNVKGKFALFHCSIGYVVV